jgi:ATP/maltotriose-dependent transcriptional regulator MalT
VWELGDLATRNGPFNLSVVVVVGVTAVPPHHPAPTLHRRAAEWFQAHDYPEDALHHAFAIPDYAYVSRLVVDSWRRIYHQGRLETAVHWLESLPGDLLRQSPPLAVAYCWTLFIRGDYDRIATITQPSGGTISWNGVGHRPPAG